MMFLENFHFCRAFYRFVAWLAFIPALGSTVFAQPVLERLEQQIRQRVSSPEQGGRPGNAPGMLPPPPSDQPSSMRYIGKASDQTRHIYIGVTVDDRKDRGRGVRITDVRPGSPADKAGLHKQDLITGLLDARVRQMSDLTEILSLLQPDDTVDLDILRDGESQKIKLTLGRPIAQPSEINQTAEEIPLPPGELIIPKSQPAVKANQSANYNSTGDPEKNEQMQKRIAELERQVAELERKLSEQRKKDKK
jgi:hypothetical protein